MQLREVGGLFLGITPAQDDLQLQSHWRQLGG